jgi:hypothetical protein
VASFFLSPLKLSPSPETQRGAVSCKASRIARLLTDFFVVKSLGNTQEKTLGKRNNHMFAV